MILIENIFILLVKIQNREYTIELLSNQNFKQLSKEEQQKELKGLFEEFLYK